MKLFFTALLIAASVNAQSRRAGKYEVTLLPPAAGLYAQEEIDVAFRIKELDAKGDRLPVKAARIRGELTMPSMPGMPKFEQLAHAHGVAGEFGVHPTFPHGGEYMLRLTIGESAVVEFPLQVDDASTEKRSASPYQLNVVTVPAQPRAGEEAELRVSVTLMNTLDQRSATEFEEVHEKLMHLFLVRTDLSQFAHEHPVAQSGGVFSLRHKFSAGGLYRVVADVAPKSAGAQMLSTSVMVLGDPGERFDIYGASVGDRKLKQKLGDVEIAFDVAAKLPAKKTIVLKAASSEALEPYLGVMGHLFLINQDGETFVHSHPDDRTPVTAGTLPFLTRFPKPGLYRGWVQIKRSGEVRTGDFIVEAE